MSVVVITKLMAATGSLIVTDTFEVQPLASVTITLYVPAISPVAVESV